MLAFPTICLNSIHQCSLCQKMFPIPWTCMSPITDLHKLVRPCIGLFAFESNDNKLSIKQSTFISKQVVVIQIHHHVFHQWCSFAILGRNGHHIVQVIIFLSGYKENWYTCSLKYYYANYEVYILKCVRHFLKITFLCKSDLCVLLGV